MAVAFYSLELDIPALQCDLHLLKIVQDIHSHSVNPLEHESRPILSRFLELYIFLGPAPPVWWPTCKHVVFFFKKASNGIIFEEFWFKKDEWIEERAIVNFLVVNINSIFMTGMFVIFVVNLCRFCKTKFLKTRNQVCLMVTDAQFYIIYNWLKSFWRKIITLVF